MPKDFMKQLCGTATLVYELNKRQMIVLADGRILIGWLRMIDGFGNLVLHRTIERIYVGQNYGEVMHGVYLIRGENIVLLGEIDQAKENDLRWMEQSIAEIHCARAVQLEKLRQQNRIRRKIFQDNGLPLPPDEMISDDFC